MFKLLVTYLEFTFGVKLFIDHLKVLDKIETGDLVMKVQIFVWFIVNMITFEPFWIYHSNLNLNNFTFFVKQWTVFNYIFKLELCIDPLLV